MSIKRMSLRFNMDKENERKAWEYLEAIGESKNKAVIDIINQAAEGEGPIVEIIRKTISDCLAGALIAAPPRQEPKADENEDRELLLEYMDSLNW